MSIVWLDKKFEGPFTVKYWEPPRCPVIYALMIKPDPHNNPTSFRVLYFGQYANLSDMRFYQRHRKKQCWLNFAGQENNLHIAYLPLPKTTVEERVDLLEAFIARYKPVCNF